MRVSRMFRVILMAIAAMFGSTSLMGCVYAVPHHGSHRKVEIDIHRDPHKRVVYHRHCDIHKRWDDCDWRRDSHRNDRDHDRWGRSDRGGRDYGHEHKGERRQDWAWHDDRNDRGDRDDRFRKEDRDRKDFRDGRDKRTGKPGMKQEGERDGWNRDDRRRDDRTWGERG